jgi:hypothetical protein
MCVKVVSKSNLQSKTPSRVTLTRDKIMYSYSMKIFGFLLANTYTHTHTHTHTHMYIYTYIFFF